MEAFAASLVLWAKAQAAGFLARHWPKLVAAVVVVATAAVFLAVTAVSLVSSNGHVAAAANACTELGYVVDEAAYQPPPVDQTPTIPTGGAVPGFGPDDADKIVNAQAITAAGAEAGVGRRGLIVAIATALQESGLENLDHGDRDSLGLFQQRPSQGWGTAEQVRDPRFAALAFFGARRRRTSTLPPARHHRVVCSTSQVGRGCPSRSRHRACSGLPSQVPTPSTRPERP